MRTTFCAAVLLAAMAFQAQARERFTGIFIGGGVGYSRTSGQLEMDRTTVTHSVSEIINTVTRTAITEVENRAHLDTRPLTADDVCRRMGGCDGPFGYLVRAAAQVAADLANQYGLPYVDDMARAVAERIDPIVQTVTATAHATQITAVIDRAHSLESLSDQSVTLQAAMLGQFKIGDAMLGIDLTYSHQNLRLDFDCAVMAPGTRCEYRQGANARALGRLGAALSPSLLAFATAGAVYSWNDGATVTQGGAVLRTVAAPSWRPAFGGGLQFAPASGVLIEAVGLAMLGNTSKVAEFHQTEFTSTALDARLTVDPTYEVTIRALFRLN